MGKCAVCLEKAGLLLSTQWEPECWVQSGQKLLTYQQQPSPWRPFLPVPAPLVLGPSLFSITCLFSSLPCFLSLSHFLSRSLLNFFSLSFPLYPWLSLPFLSVCISLCLFCASVFSFLFVCFPLSSPPFFHLLSSVSSTWSTGTGEPPGVDEW